MCGLPKNFTLILLADVDWFLWVGKQMHNYVRCLGSQQHSALKKNKKIKRSYGPKRRVLKGVSARHKSDIDAPFLKPSPFSVKSL